MVENIRSWTRHCQICTSSSSTYKLLSPNNCLRGCVEQSWFFSPLESQRHRVGRQDPQASILTVCVVGCLPNQHDRREWLDGTWIRLWEPSQISGFSIHSLPTTEQPVISTVSSAVSICKLKSKNFILEAYNQGLLVSVDTFASLSDSSQVWHPVRPLAFPSWSWGSDMFSSWF